MRECYSQYQDERRFPRTKIPTTIDDPATFFGFTWEEGFFSAIATGVFVVLGRGTFLPLLAMPIGLAILVITRNFRKKVTKNFLAHFLWSYGLPLTHVKSPLPAKFFSIGVVRRFGP